MEKDIIKGALPLEKAQSAKSLSVLSLAYMGDAVLEILSREYVISRSGKVKPGELVYETKKFITCEAQSDAVERIADILNDDEQDIFRRGRNAKTHFTPKHGDVIQYRRATGFEALMGYLYLSGNISRMKELFTAAYEIKDARETPTE